MSIEETLIYDKDRKCHTIKTSIVMYHVQRLTQSSIDAYNIDQN